MSSPVLLNGIWQLGEPTAAYRLRPSRAKTIIYDARHAQTGEAVSVLMIRPPWCDSPGIREIYRYGVQQVRALNHPNILRVHDLLDGPGLLGTVAEPLAGDDISRLLRYGAATFSEAQIVSILRQLASALEYAHSQGVIFGTIRPSNIELTPDAIVKISAMPKPPYRFTSFLDAADYLGYPRYCAPEVIRCEPLDPRTDVFGLGLTAYEMMASSLQPSPTDHLASELNAVVSEELPAPATQVQDLDPLLNKIVVRCLHKDRERRYPSAAAVREDLERVPGKSECLIGQRRLLEIMSTVFPSPLAALAEALERDDHLLTQRDRLLNQAGGLISYLGFVAAASSAEPLPRELGRPSLGHWIGLVRQALRSTKKVWPITAIVTQLADVDDFLQGLDAVVQLRNEIAHAAAPEEGPGLHHWIQRMSIAIRRACKSALFLAHYKLVAVEDMDYQAPHFMLKLQSLVGSMPAGPLKVALAQPYTKGRVYFAAGDLSRMIALHPWVVLAKCPLCFQRELFFYVAERGGDLHYVTPDRGHGLTTRRGASGPA